MESYVCLHFGFFLSIPLYESRENGKVLLIIVLCRMEEESSIDE